jgi:hypothetical protein
MESIHTTGIRELNAVEKTIAQKTGIPCNKKILGNKNTLNKKVRKQRGSLLVEAALVLPIMSLFLISFYEYYRYFITLRSFSHTAREVSIIANTIQGITGQEINLFKNDAEVFACLSNINGAGCKHTVLQSAAHKLILSQPHFIKPNSLVINTRRDTASSEFIISISADFASSFSLFKLRNFIVSEKIRYTDV